MKDILLLIDNINKSEGYGLIKKRMKEFKKVGRSQIDTIFVELCFCILTANFNAERAIQIQNSINKHFLFLSKRDLIKRLKELGHRFPKTRANFIIEARRNLEPLKKVLNSNLTEFEKRNWLVKNIKGVGMKEASHFLRNIGYKNLAILDFHIINLLRKYNLIKPFRSLSKNKYLEIENILKSIAESSGLSLGELDLYLWYAETNKVLK
ncbi:MAG: N-glycosylase/DNA lyase [Candidatus Pacearchaeota archaeon]